MRKAYLRKTRNLRKTELTSRNLIKGINTWAVLLVRYTERKVHIDLKKINWWRCTSGRWHQQILYVMKKKEEVEWIALRIALMHQYKDYIKKSEERLISTANCSCDNISTDRKASKTRRCPWCNGYRRRKWTRWQLKILDETGCISHSTNTLGKGMNPVILPPAMGK